MLARMLKKRVSVSRFILIYLFYFSSYLKTKERNQATIFLCVCHEWASSNVHKSPHHRWQRMIK